MMFSSINRHVDWLVEADVSEKASALKMETARFSETLASINQSTWRLNPKDHQNHHCHENLKARDQN
jgi:hypothetical protein